MVWQIKNKIIVAGNHEYKQTKSINLVQSSLKSHPLWVTLYISKIFQPVFLTLIFNRNHAEPPIQNNRFLDGKTKIYHSFLIRCKFKGYQCENNMPLSQFL